MILSGEASLQVPEAAENRPVDWTRVLLRLIDKTASVLIAAAYAGGLVGVTYYLSLAVGHLAGHNTALLVSYLTDTGSGLTVTVSLTTGVFGGIYGLRQRWLYRRAVAYFAPRLARYEQQMDPNRSSSGLTPQGKTNPDDI